MLSILKYLLLVYPLFWSILSDIEKKGGYLRNRVIKKNIKSFCFLAFLLRKMYGIFFQDSLKKCPRTTPETKSRILFRKNV